MFHSIVVENSLHLRQASALEDVLQVSMPDSHALETCPCRSYDPVLKIKRTVLFVRMRLRSTRNRPVRSQQLHVLRHPHPHIQDFLVATAQFSAQSPPRCQEMQSPPLETLPFFQSGDMPALLKADQFRARD